MKVEPQHIDDDRDALVERVVATSPVLHEVHRRLLADNLLHVNRCQDGAAGILVAHLAEQLQRPLVILCSSPDAAERLRRDASTFTAEPIGHFGMWESLFEEDSEPDPETFRERLETVKDLESGSLRTIVAPIQAVLQPLSRETGEDHRVLLRRGDRRDPGDLARSLVKAGYRRFPQVARPGDFAIRGGLLDVWPRESSSAYRLDFFDDEIDSIRSISPRDHRTGEEMEVLVLTIAPKEAWFIRGWTGKEQLLFDALSEDAVVAVWDPQEVEVKNSAGGADAGLGARVLALQAEKAELEADLLSGTAVGAPSLDGEGFPGSGDLQSVVRKANATLTKRRILY